MTTTSTPASNAGSQSECWRALRVCGGVLLWRAAETGMCLMHTGRDCDASMRSVHVQQAVMWTTARSAPKSAQGAAAA